MIICVTGGKGGPGATVLAANIAGALARQGRSCLLLDLDPWGGDIASYLDPQALDPRRGLLPLLKLERGPIAPDAVVRETQEFLPRLRVLLGTLRPSRDLLAGRVLELLHAASGLASVVVADLGRADFESPSLDALRSAGRVLIAAQPHLQGALAAERALHAIGEIQGLRLVATKVRRHRVTDVVELSEALGRPIRFSIPYWRAANHGIAHARRMRRAFERAAGALVNGASATAASPGRAAQVVAR